MLDGSNYCVKGYDVPSCSYFLLILRISLNLDCLVIGFESPIDEPAKSAEDPIRHGQHEINAGVVGFRFLERIVALLTGGCSHCSLSGRAGLSRARRRPGYQT